jgi:hypothetical protein
LSNNEIVRRKEELNTVDEGTEYVDVFYGKGLMVDENTEGIDVDGLLANFVQYFNVGNSLRNIKKATEYVVQIPLKHQDAFNKGEVFINESSKTGLQWATLVRKGENGRRVFVDNLPIKQQEFVQGNPIQEMALGYHNVYMQKQIAELSDQIAETFKAVKRIEQGQLDDRIGLLISGKDQFVIAMELPEEERKLAIANARTSISNAQGKIFETLRRRVNSFQPVPEQEWKRFLEEVKHKGYLREKYDAYNEILEYYDLYLQSTNMLSASYALCGNMSAAEKVYDQSIAHVKELNFGRVKTLEHMHRKRSGMLYDNAVGYLAFEKEERIGDAKEYDYITIEVTGEKLLEVAANGEEIREEETE